MASGRLKTFFITGLIVLLPIMLTIIAIQFFIKLLFNIVITLFPFLPKLPFRLEIIITLFALVFLTFLVGFLVVNFFKKRLENFIDLFFSRIPVIRSLYTGTKKVTEAMLSDSDKKAFKRVVLVPFPSKGVYSLGFVTQERVNLGKEFVMVFIPQAPLPNNGYVMIVKKSELKDAGISVNAAVKLIFSGGILDQDNKINDIKNI